MISWPTNQHHYFSKTYIQLHVVHSVTSARKACLLLYPSVPDQALWSCNTTSRLHTALRLGPCSSLLTSSSHQV